MTQLYDLVEQYSAGVSAENLRNLQTLFDHLVKCRDRAEALTRSAFSQLEILTKRLSVLENGEPPERQPRQPREPGEPQTPNAQTSKVSAKADKVEKSAPKGAIEIEF